MVSNRMSSVFTILLVILSLLAYTYAEETYESPVLAAILQENDALLREVLQNGGNPNENVAGWTPLHAAASKGNKAWVNLLIQKGGNVNAQNNDKRTPLHEAIGESHVEVAKILLENHSDPNAQDKNGDSPLHIASALSLPSVTLLLSNKANPNLVNANGASPLFFAAAFGKPDIVKYLLKNGANAHASTVSQLTALHEAGISGNVEVLEALVAAGVSVNAHSADGWTPLHNAAQFSHFDFAKALLEKGANANQKHTPTGRTPLAVACLNATKDIVDLLLRHGADHDVPDVTGTYPIHIAAFRGDVDMLTVLYDEGANLNARDGDGAVPLHKAVFSQHSKAVKYLIQRGANPDLGTFDKRWTPLMVAVALKDLSSVKLLVEGGADVRIASFDRASPTQVAAAAGATDILEYLVNKGASLDTFDAKGWTPLHNAIQGNHVETVKLILKHVDPNKTYNGVLPVTLAGILGLNDLIDIILRANGASPNVEDAEGWTPIQHLSGLGNAEAVELLIKAGGNVNHLNKEGKSALEIAQINDKYNVIGALASGGADLKSLDVPKWLHFHDLDYLADVFVENQITGDILPDLTKSILKEELGITKIGSLVKITKAISTLQPSRRVHDEL